MAKEKIVKGFLTLPKPDGGTVEVVVDLTRLQLGDYSLDVKDRGRGNLVGKRKSTPFSLDLAATYRRELTSLLERVLKLVVEGRQRLITEHDEIGEKIATLVIDTLPLTTLAGLLASNHDAWRLVEESVRIFLGKTLLVARMCEAAATDSSSATVVSQLAETSAKLEAQVQTFCEVLDLAYESLGGAAQPADESLRGVAAQFVRSLLAVNAEQTLATGQRLARVLDRTQQALREPSLSTTVAGLRLQLHVLRQESEGLEQQQARLDGEQAALKQQLCELAESDGSRADQIQQLKGKDGVLRALIGPLIAENAFEQAKELVEQLATTNAEHQRLLGIGEANAQHAADLQRKLEELRQAEVALANTASAVQTKRRVLDQAAAVLDGRLPAELTASTPHLDSMAPAVESATVRVGETPTLDLLDALPLDVLNPANHVRGALSSLGLTVSQLLTLTASGELVDRLTQANYGGGNRQIIHQCQLAVRKFLTEHNLLTSEGLQADHATIRQSALGWLTRLTNIRPDGSVTITGRTSRQARVQANFCWFLRAQRANQWLKITATASTGLAKHGELVSEVAVRAQVETLTISGQQQAALAAVLASHHLRLVPHHLSEFAGWLEVAAEKS